MYSRRECCLSLTDWTHRAVTQSQSTSFPAVWWEWEVTAHRTGAASGMLIQPCYWSSPRAWADWTSRGQPVILVCGCWMAVSQGHLHRVRLQMGTEPNSVMICGLQWCRIRVRWMQTRQAPHRDRLNTHLFPFSSYNQWFLIHGHVTLNSHWNLDCK